jgi:hypothetical protein
VIAAWPSFALTASYELLTRQVRRSSASTDSPGSHPQRPRTAPAPPTKPAPAAELRLARPPDLGKGNRIPGVDFAVAFLAVGTGPSCPWWQSAQRQRDRRCPWPPRAVGPPGQERRPGRHLRIPRPGADRPPHDDPGEVAAAGSEGGR